MAKLSAPGRARTLQIADEAAMSDLGATLQALAVAGDVITLRGDLGAGKTVLARGFVRKACAGSLADAATFDVPSPTFTLVQVYESPDFAVWHFDLYRLEAADEIWELGFEEALDEGVSLIEWPQRVANLLPDERLDVLFKIHDDGAGRDVTLKPGPGWEERIAHARF